MGGLLLYLCTLLLELLSVTCRFLLVAVPMALVGSTELAIVVGTLLAVAPVFYSLLVVNGIPSGHFFLRWTLRARRPTVQERRAISGAFCELLPASAPRPRHIFVLDKAGLNAFVSGTTLYVYRDLIRSRFLNAVLAHELGHLYSPDGRLALALRALVLPGAFGLAHMLLLLLAALQRVIVWLLNRLIRLFALYILVDVLQFVVRVFLGILPRTFIIIAMGGIGPRLLDAPWQRHFILREYDADAYAARLGQRARLIEFFLLYGLDDLSIPWSERPTHPSTRDRIDHLLRSPGMGQPAGAPSVASGTHKSISR
jgi:Zn-dependent protease with chaperone function